MYQIPCWQLVQGVSGRSEAGMLASTGFIDSVPWIFRYTVITHGWAGLVVTTVAVEPSPSASMPSTPGRWLMASQSTVAQPYLCRCWPLRSVSWQSQR